MRTTRYEDYKYSMQDVGNLYIGSRYTLAEILDNEEIYFKFRLIAERYILPEANPEDTLETHLYYLDEKSFLVKIYSRLKGRVKISVIREKTGLGGKVRRAYVTETIPVEKFVRMSVQEKEAAGVVVQELAVSKLAMLAF